MMKEFKIGGKVIINENESYRIIDIVTIDNNIYYFACTEQKTVKPIIFERIENDEKTYINIVENPEIIKVVSEKILESSNG